MNKKSLAYKIKPFILSVVLVVLDQITKLWVMKTIPENTIYKVIGDDLIWIVHVRNTGAAFSLGASYSDFVRLLLFIIFPIAVIIFACYAVVSNKNILTRTQQYFTCGIIGGGIGTMIDRIFRFNEGVVDFISIKFFGIFGLDRWPTFNVSDSCVVVFVILFAISVLFSKEESK